MTLRRARLCGNDARGFTFAREISSSFNGRRRLTGHPRGLWRLVAVGRDFRFFFFAKDASFQKVHRAPFGFRFRVGTLLSGSFKRDAARVIGKPFHWFAP